MLPHQRLSDVFNRAKSDGVESLTEDERGLYLIQDFIIEIEMNGLSGYFYNRLPYPGHISSTIASMQHYGLLNLAALLNTAYQNFKNYVPAHLSRRWSDILKECDPEKTLADIEDRIYMLDNYGLANSCIK